MRLFVAALRTVLWTPLFYCGSALIAIAAGVAALYSTPSFEATVAQWGRWQRWCARVLLGQHVEMQGVLPQGPTFFVFKHEAMFETIDMPMLLHRPVVFAKRELFSIPVWGRLALKYGLIPIERSAGASALRTMRKAALAAIADGRPVVLLPEGTRVPHGQRPPLRAGFAGLYKIMGLPVVPVAVDSGRLKHGWIRLPGIITYRVEPEIPPGLPREEAEARIHAAINSLNS